MKKDINQNRKGKLIALFAFFFFLLNFPVLGLMDDEACFNGIPAIFTYFLIIWVVLIISIWSLVRKKNSNS